MINRVSVAVALVLGAALAVQAANSRHEDDEAEKLLQSIQQSLREAMPGAIITSSLTAEDLRNMDPPSIYKDPEWQAARRRASAEERSASAKVAAASAKVAAASAKAAAQRKRVARAAEPDDDAEEVPAGEAAAPAEAEPGCEDGQPPATGLRRWVIRIRNIMFGRRDLEGSEGGEAEGEPESGRTWMESLAHWFAHGIKRMLVRISGGEQPAEAGAEDGAEATTASSTDGAPSERPGTALPPAPAPAPGRKEPTTTPAPPASEASDSPASEVKAPGKAPAKTPGKAPGKVPNKIPTEVPTKAPTRASAPSDTVYDEEVYNKPRPAFDETNELS